MFRRINKITNFARHFSTFNPQFGAPYVIATSTPYRFLTLNNDDGLLKFVILHADDFRGDAFYKFNEKSIKHILQNPKLAQAFLKPKIYNAFKTNSDHLSIESIPAKTESCSGYFRYITGPVQVFPEPMHKADKNGLLKLYYPNGLTSTLEPGTKFTVKLCDEKGNILSHVEYGPGKNNIPSKRTTGWTNATRNQFHPGDIITIIRIDYAGYSPHNLLGATELACHLLGEGREFSYPHVREDGAIMGFYFNVMPRMKKIQSTLREMFPELAEFSDSLASRDLKSIFESPEKIQDLVNEIEAKFGKIINVSAPKSKNEPERPSDNYLMRLFLFGNRRPELSMEQQEHQVPKAFL